MSGSYRAFGYVFAANVEAVIMFFAGWWSGEWLNEKYPQSFDWMIVTFVIALLIVMRSWYLMFRTLIREDNASRHPHDRSPKSRGL